MATTGERASSLSIVSRCRLLSLSLSGLVLVEQFYRNVQPQQRWGIKFLCLGLGGIFACDFYLYSDALLFRGFDVNFIDGIVNDVGLALRGIGRGLRRLQSGDTRAYIVAILLGALGFVAYFLWMIQG